MSSSSSNTTSGDDEMTTTTTRRQNPNPSSSSAAQAQQQQQQPPLHSSFKSQADQELIRLALHKSPFFTCLDEEQVERLVMAAVLETFQPGDAVILEGCIDQTTTTCDSDNDDYGDDEEYEEEDEDYDQQRQSSSVSLFEEAPADPDEYMLEDEDDDDEIKDNEIKDEEEKESTNKEDLKIPAKSAEVLAAADEGIPIYTSSKHPFTVTAGMEHDTGQEQASYNNNNNNNNNSLFPINTSNVADPPSPPVSHRKRALYIVASGHADVIYNTHFNPASLGPGTVFGEGGFLFGRQHSASIVAAGGSRSFQSQHQQNDKKQYITSFQDAPAEQQQAATTTTSTDTKGVETLQCWVIDFDVFRNYVLPSANMTALFEKYAIHTEPPTARTNGKKQKQKKARRYMTMTEFVQACQEQEAASNIPAMPDPMVSLRIANTYNIILKRNSTQSHSSSPNREQHDTKIFLPDFCLFHLLMARPDPEVDIAFLLMDQRGKGQVDLQDLQRFLQPIFPTLDVTSEFFQRYFGATATAQQQQQSPRSIRQAHFSQFLVDLQKEMGQQAFCQAVAKYGTPEGYLQPVDFVHVLKTACGWRLPTGVADRLEAIYCSGPIQAGENTAAVSIRAGNLKRSSTLDLTRTTELSVLADMDMRERLLGDRYFCFADFVAFQEVLANLPGICNLIDRAQEIKQGPVSPDDFKVANRVLGLGGRLSRRQVELIFQLFDIDKDGFVSHEDTVSVCGVDFAQRLVAVTGRQGKLTFAPPPEFRHGNQKNKKKGDSTADHGGINENGTRATGSDDGVSDDDLLEAKLRYNHNQHITLGAWMQHFGLTAVSGAIGIIALYPLDLVKTRLENQRIPLDTLGSQQQQHIRMYNNSLECFQKALRNERFHGLYRGLGPQLLGVAPEKVIKLQVNDLLRMAFATNDEETGKLQIDLKFEALAGACAGACQLLVTNPMEITKIRMQMQGETAQLLRQKGLTPPPLPQTMASVVRDLGFPGVYRGAAACLLRDIPFSTIYFPAYAACKEYLISRRQHDTPGRGATPSDLLLAGTLAGVPAALLTTPADVIKTRLQVVTRPGEMSYNGIRDCATKMYHTEGPSAFFQGSFPRVLRIAPQFGISLLAYETLAQFIGLPNNSTHTAPTNAFIDPYDYRTAFPARAIHNKAADIDGWLQSYSGGGGNNVPSPTATTRNNGGDNHKHNNQNNSSS